MTVSIVFEGERDTEEAREDVVLFCALGVFEILAAEREADAARRGFAAVF
jgi:hypothetical protein